MMQVWVAGRKLKLDPSAIVGQGGEAEVYDIGKGEVLKLFKTKDHPDLAGNGAAERAAEERLAEHQLKLRAFPAALPPAVVTPTALATTRDGSTVLGYSMRRLTSATPMSRLGDRCGRPAGLGGNGIAALLVDLHRTVSGLHRGHVVIGD